MANWINPALGQILGPILRANLLPLLRGLESDGGGLEGWTVGGVLLDSQGGRGGGPFSRGAFPLWSDEGLRKIEMQTAAKIGIRMWER